MKNNSEAVNRWKILPVILLGPFMGSLDSSIVNVALPSLTGNFHTGLEQTQWIVSSYLITISALILIAGKISDLIGRVRIYKYGFVVFGLGSAFCAISRNLPVMILARIFQAVGAALFMSSNQAIIVSLFPKNERGQALGLLGTTVAIGTMIGPPLGGFIVTYFNWSWLFLINVPIAVIAILAIHFYVPEKKKDISFKNFDFKGSLLFIIVVTCFFYFLLDVEKSGWLTAPHVLAISVCVLSLILFILIEKRHESPMMDLGLFRSMTFTISIISVIIVFSANFCVNITQPFYLQDVSGFSPALSGLMLLATPLASAFIAPLGGFISDRYSPEPLTIIGLIIEIIALTGICFLHVGSRLGFIIFLLALFGVGIGFFNSPNTKIIMSNVHPSKFGIAGSINALGRNIGMIMGITVAVSMTYSIMHRQAGYNRSGNIAENKIAYMAGMKGSLVFIIIFLSVAVFLTLFSLAGKKKAASTN